MKILKSVGLEEALKHTVVLLSFLAFTFAVFSLLNPHFSGNATDQSASSGSAAYTASISTSDSVPISITPTDTQEIYTGLSRIRYTNTCPYGFTVTMSAASSDTNLTRKGNDSAPKTIPTISTGTALADNTWGYTISGNAFYNPIPPLASPVALLNTSTATTDPTNLDVIYGVKTSTDVPVGNYKNSVIYTVAVKPQCLTYTLKWDLNGGTGKSGASYADTSVNYGQKINLLNYTPTRSGYTFTGWSNASSTYTPDTGEIDPNPSNLITVTLTAQWQQNVTGIHAISNMQDMTATVCANTTTPAKTATSFDWDGSKHGNTSYVPRKKLKDTRDNKYYLVSKLADGNCWMSQSLALDLTSGTAITASTTSGGTVSKTPNNTTQTSTGTTWAQADNNWRSYKPQSSEAYYRAGTTKSSSATGSGDTYLWESAGNYYNWYAATAGTGTSSMTSSDATASICPKGWRLPPNSTASKSYYYLITTTYGLASSAAGSTSLRADPLNFNLSGDYDYSSGAMGGQGSGGVYWSSTAYSSATVAYNLYFNTSYIYPQNYGYKGHGFSVRCVAL